jgi:hypothetical protein
MGCIPKLVIGIDNLGVVPGTIKDSGYFEGQKDEILSHGLLYSMGETARRNHDNSHNFSLLIQ